MAYTGQTLHNPASGERITFRRTAAETNGELLAIDLELPPGRRVPGGLHVHPLQEERFEVVEGTMRFRVGRERITAGPGESSSSRPGCGTTSPTVATRTRWSASRCGRRCRWSGCSRPRSRSPSRGGRCWAASRGRSTSPCSSRSSPTRSARRSRPAGCSAWPLRRWRGWPGAGAPSRRGANLSPHANRDRRVGLQPAGRFAAGPGEAR